MISEPIQENHNSPNGETQGINIKEMLFKYLHYSWLFLLMLAISLIGAWLYLRYTKPSYSVYSTLLIRNENANRGGGAGGEEMFADIALFQSNTNKQNEIEILQSRTMMERVVQALGLQEKYHVVGNVKSRDIYNEAPFDLQIISIRDSNSSFSIPIHFIEKNRFTIGENPKEHFVGEIFDHPFGKFSVRLRESSYTNLPFNDFLVQWYPLPIAAETVGKALDVIPANDLSNVLRLTYVTENPKLGSDVLNQLMAEYNDAAIEDKNEINRKIISFIDDRLQLVESQLDSVERDLQLYKTNRQAIDLEAQSQFYFGNMGELEQNIRQQEIQLQVAVLLENYLRDPANRVNLVPSTLGLTDPTLLELVAGYNRLVSERERQLQTGATPNNPAVTNLDKDIEDARMKMLQNIQNIQQVYRSTINSLSAQSGSIRKEISSIPQKERESRERARQQEIKQNLYLYLLQKKEESAIAEASTIANSRVIDKSRPAMDRVSPIPMRIYLIAVLAGILLPVIIIYLIELLNDKVIVRGDITRATNAPIVGEIGHSEEDRLLLFPHRSRTVIAEQLRILRSNLRFVLGDKEDRPTLMVTSSFSGEGKSFVSTNLGAALAVSGKRTVILEFDLRKPKVTAGLGLPKGQGITNYLVGGASLAQLPQAVPEVENLYVIPCGPVPPNPSEILLTEKIKDLFAWLEKEFDAIVIDTAPVGLVSDAMTLSKYADATLYIVRQRYTFKRQLQFINELYEQRKLPKLGLIVNDVTSEGAKGYYGYGGGSYGYGYGYGYGHKNGGGYYENSRSGFWQRLRKKIKLS